MELIIDKLNELKKIVANKATSHTTVYEFIRTKAPELVNDIDDLKTYLLSTSESEEQKYNLVSTLHRASEYFIKYRSHSANNKNELYDIFCEIYKDKHLSSNEFIKFYSYINSTTLKGKEIDCVEKAYELVNILKILHFLDNEIVHFLSFSSSTNGITEDELIDYLDKDISKEQRKRVKLCLRTLKQKVCLDAASLIVTNPDSNDCEVENKNVYYAYSSFILNSVNKRHIIAFPSPFFVKKLLNDSLINSNEYIIVVNNEDMVIIYSQVYKQKNVKFTTMENFEFNAMMSSELVGTMLFFANSHENDSDLISIIEMIESYHDETTNVLIFGPDNRIDSKKLTIKRYLVDNNYSVCSATLFPSGINNCTKPERKILLIFSRKKVSSININSYSLNRSGEYQLLKLIPYQATMQSEVYKNSNLRAYYNHEYDNHLLLTNQERKISSFIDYSNEIRIRYTASPQKNSNCPVINVYIKTPIINRNGTINKDKGNKMDCSRKQITNILLSQLDSFINDKYFFISKRSNMDGLSIRSDVSNEFKNVLSSEEISFKSLFLFYEDIENSLSKEENAIIKELLDGELGWILPRNLNSKLINDYLDNYYRESEDNRNKIIAKRLISKLFDYAIAKGHAKNNPIKGELRFINKDRQGIIDVKNARNKASINLKQFKTLVRNVESSYKHNLSIMVAILLKIFTPLEYREICALRIMDIFKFKHFTYKGKEIYYLKIRRFVDDSGHFKQLTTSYKYRNIVLPIFLSDLLLALKNIIASSHTDIPALRVQETPLFEGDLILANKEYAILSPYKLSKMCKKELKKLNIKDDITYLHTKDGKEEVNLSNSHSDLLRNNYRYYSIMECKYTEDELEHSCGNKATDVFSNNYCDYDSEPSMYQMLIKQERLSSLIFDEKKYLSYKQTHNNETINYLSHNISSRTILNIEVCANVQATINISNDYGFDMIRTNNEENENE